MRHRQFVALSIGAVVIAAAIAFMSGGIEHSPVTDPKTSADATTGSEADFEMDASQPERDGADLRMPSDFQEGLSIRIEAYGGGDRPIVAGLEGIPRGREGGWDFDEESGVLSLPSNTSLDELTLHAKGFHSIPCSMLIDCGLVHESEPGTYTAQLIARHRIPIRVISPDSTPLQGAWVVTSDHDGKESISELRTNESGFVAAAVGPKTTSLAMGNSVGITPTIQVEGLRARNTIHAIPAAYTQIIDARISEIDEDLGSGLQAARLPLDYGSGLQLKDSEERLRNAMPALQAVILETEGIPFEFGPARKVAVFYDPAVLSGQDALPAQLVATCKLRNFVPVERKISISASGPSVQTVLLPMSPTGPKPGFLAMAWAPPQVGHFPTGFDSDFLIFLKSEDETGLLEFVAKLDAEGSEVLGGIPPGEYDVHYRPIQISGPSVSASQGTIRILPGQTIDLFCDSKGLGWWALNFDESPINASGRTEMSISASIDPDYGKAWRRGGLSLHQSELQGQRLLPLQSGWHYFLSFSRTPFFEQEGVVPMSLEETQTIPFSSGYIGDGGIAELTLARF